MTDPRHPKHLLCYGHPRIYLMHGKKSYHVILIDYNNYDIVAQDSHKNWHVQLTLIREFLGPSPSVISGKKIQSTETHTNDATLRSGFFPQNTLGDGPAFWIFPGFTDKG